MTSGGGPVSPLPTPATCNLRTSPYRAPVSRPLVLLAWMGLLSLAAFLAHVLDKRAAARGGRRVPERTLHLLALLGGWPGSLAAMSLVRHKTRKCSFLALTAGVVLLHAALGYAAWKSGWLSG